MNIKYKILTDKHGWFFQEPNTDICTLISALNALKYFNLKIKKKTLTTIFNSVYKNQIGLGFQDFMNLLSVLNLSFDFGHFDLKYIKYMLDHNSPIILDTLILNFDGMSFTHMMFVSKYKIKKGKTYLFCSNMSHTTGSKWVAWSDLKKYKVKYNGKSFCKNVCLAVMGELYEQRN